MRSSYYTFAILISVVLHTQAYAKEVVDTNVNLSCSVSGIYTDGSKVSGSGIEDISVEIKRINFNDKEPQKPPSWGSMQNIKIKSNGANYEASLLTSTKDKVAFGFANDTKADGKSKTLAFIYEIKLNSLELKRTVISLFSSGSNLISANEGKCIRR